MIYSVYNPGKREFDYYETRVSSGDAEVPVPRLGNQLSKLGLTPEEASWRLPFNARYIGSGTLAKGMVSSKGRSSLRGSFGDDSSPSNWTKPVGIALLVYGLYRVIQ